MTDFLLDIIEINRRIEEDDMNDIDTFIAKINSYDLDEDDINYLNDFISPDRIVEFDGTNKVIRKLIDEIKYVKDKEIKILTLDLTELKNSDDMIYIADWLENNAISALESASNSQSLRFIARNLILFCTRTKKFEVMAQIREKLEELTSKEV